MMLITRMMVALMKDMRRARRKPSSSNRDKAGETHGERMAAHDSLGIHFYKKYYDVHIPHTINGLRCRTI